MLGAAREGTHGIHPLHGIHEDVWNALRYIEYINSIEYTEKIYVECIHGDLWTPKETFKLLKGTNHFCGNLLLVHKR